MQQTLKSEKVLKNNFVSSYYGNENKSPNVQEKAFGQTSLFRKGDTFTDITNMAELKASIRNSSKENKEHNHFTKDSYNIFNKENQLNKESILNKDN